MAVALTCVPGDMVHQLLAVLERLVALELRPNPVEGTVFNPVRVRHVLLRVRCSIRELVLLSRAAVWHLCAKTVVVLHPKGRQSVAIDHVSGNASNGSWSGMGNIIRCGSSRGDEHSTAQR